MKIKIIEPEAKKIEHPVFYSWRKNREVIVASFELSCESGYVIIRQAKSEGLNPKHLCWSMISEQFEPLPSGTIIQLEQP